MHMGLTDAKNMLTEASLGLSSCAISVACDNGPISTVLSGPLAELERVFEYLEAKNVKSTFLKGSTAFHCSLMDPILPEVDARLRFLNRPRRTCPTTEANVPKFLSTVTARPHTSVTSKYIVHNIRQPVKFRETVDLLLHSHEPDVVLEVGPTPTLSPLVDQCAQAAKKQTIVLPSLVKGANDVGCFWKIIKGLREAGMVNIDLAAIFRNDLGFKFSRVEEKRIPRHPKISREAESWIYHEATHNFAGKREAGPAAGTWVSDADNLVSVVEISKATSSPMDEHIMGGIAILPGMYYVEAAIETWACGGLGDVSQGISMTDVTFQAICPIPDRAKAQPRKLFVRHSADKPGEAKSFTVESMQLRDASASSVTVHCSGQIASFARPADDVLDGSQYMPGVMGTRKRSPATRDIGQEGGCCKPRPTTCTRSPQMTPPPPDSLTLATRLFVRLFVRSSPGLARLLEAHHPLLSSKQHFYSQACDEDMAYYGPSFQVIDEIRASADRSSIVATLNYDHQSWSAKGGVFGVQLLDGMLQLCFNNPYVPSGNVAYAGGFDWGIFVRAPVDNPVIVNFQFVEDGGVGDSIVNGDARMFDANGRLLCHLMGIKSIVGKQMMHVYDAVPVWQPLSLAALASSMLTIEDVAVEAAKVSSTSAAAAAGAPRAASSGKKVLVSTELRKKHLSKSKAASRAASDPSVYVSQVLSCAQSILGKDISESDPLISAGMDLLISMEFKNELEARVGMTLPSTLVLDYPTADDIGKFLAESSGAPAASLVYEATDGAVDDRSLVNSVMSTDADNASRSDPDPRTSAIAQTIGDVLRRKHALKPGEACHLRVLELWDDAQAVPPVFAALAILHRETMLPGFDFIVEVFVATNDDNVMTRGYFIPQKHKRWLKLRLVSLPSPLLENFMFDVVSSGIGDGQGHWDDPMDFLRFASRFGYRGTVLLHAFDADQVAKWVESGYVGGGADHPDAVCPLYTSCSLLDGALICARGDERYDQSIFIVSRDDDLSRRLAAAFEQVASTSGCSGRVTVRARSVHHADKEAIRQLAADTACSPGDERHVVILDGVLDESEYAQDSFTLAARVANQIEEIAASYATGTPATTFLWLMTSNAFVPPINVDRASIHTLIPATSEFRNLRTKYVDLPSVSESLSASGPRSFETFAALVLSRPGASKYMIDVDGVVHQRLFLPREVACRPRLVPVRADDPSMFYKLDLVESSRSTGRPYEFFAHQVKRPGTGEVLVDVQYASLNFRDVMLTLNALPRNSMEGSFFGHDLGMEAAGKVVEVGPGVYNVVPGDLVMVSAAGSIASKVIAVAGNVSRLDSAIPMKDAACVLSVYTTAYHALVDMCRLRKGDRVLVHAAAGGVGHAAISICRHFEADVYVTVSHAKREYCVKTLGLPESRVFNSRDVSWFDDLMRCTDDEGVDIVINSLAGEHQLLGLQALRDGGRFCEIGKADIFSNGR